MSKSARREFWKRHPRLALVPIVIIGGFYIIASPILEGGKTAWYEMKDCIRFVRRVFADQLDIIRTNAKD